MIASSFEIALPGWVMDELGALPSPLDAESRMTFVLRLAERNVEVGTGGPFGAAVFDLDDHALLGAGVNCVVASGQSLAHAEMLALALAERRAGAFDLAASGRRRVLVTSAEPCAMCLGAACWSGVVSIECAAGAADVEAIGFDEGPKPADWAAALAARGIAVRKGVLRSRALAALTAYAERGGEIYNPSR